MTDPSSTGLMADVTIATRWLGLCLLLAAVCAPILLRLMRGLPDRGLGLGPLIGILLATAASWWMGQDWTTDNGMRARLFLSAAAIAAVGVTWLLETTDTRATKKRIPTGIHRERLILCAALLLVALIPLPFSFAGVALVVVALATISAGLWWGEWDAMKVQLRRCAQPAVAALCLFVIGFVAFLLFRAQLPGAYFGANYYGAEKAGNLMHLASAMRTTWFPVGDAWFLGEPVNYYNGGHIAVAMLAKGTGAMPGHAFNLGLATVFGLTLSTAFCLGYNVLHRPTTSTWRTIPWALLMTVAVGLFGNLDAAHQVLARDPDSSSFNFWRSSRVFSSNFTPQQDSGTITEFPIFSAMLGDLHAHHMALPIGMLVATLLVSLWRKGHRMVPTPGAWWRRCNLEVALLGVAMAAAFVVNAWDAVVYAPIVMVVVVASACKVCSVTALSRQIIWPFLSLILFCLLSLAFSALRPFGGGDIIMTILALVIAILLSWAMLRSTWTTKFQRLGGGLLAFAAVGGFAVLLAMPHLLVFTSPFEASDPLLETRFPPRLSPEVFSVPGLVIDTIIQRTPLRIVPPLLRTSLWEYLTMWGLFVLPIAGMLFTCILRATWKWPLDKGMALGFGLLAIVVLLWNAITAMAGVLAVIMALACLFVAFRREHRSPAIVWLLLAVVFLWHLFVEIFYFNDAYSGHQVRYNTPFKILYPTWPLMALGMTMALRQGFTLCGTPSLQMRGVQLLCLVVIVRLGLIYPLEGARTRIAEEHPREATLDALAWMEAMDAMPDDVRLIRWMQHNITGTPTLLEAPPRADSSSYTRVGRVSAATGLSTLIGWSHHESQWRGWSTIVPEHLKQLFDLQPSPRAAYPMLFNSLANQMEFVYQSESMNEEVINIIKRLGVDLIVVGSIERQRYGDNPGALEKFGSLEVLHQAGESILYRIDREGER